MAMRATFDLTVQKKQNKKNNNNNNNKSCPRLEETLCSFELKSFAGVLFGNRAIVVHFLKLIPIVY